MESLNPKIKRQIEIFGLCLNAESQCYNMQDLSSIFNVDEVTIKRDLKDLRFWGIDIHSTKIGVKIDIPPSIEKLREIILTYVGLCYSGNVFDKATSLLISKQKLNALQNIVILQYCIDRSLKAIVKYDNSEERLISPLLIFHSDRSWRVLNWEDGKGVKQFHLSKIKSISPTDIAYDKMPEEDFESLFKFSWRSWLGMEKIKIRLSISDEWVSRLRELYFVEGQEVFVNEDGSGIFECYVNSVSELASWIVSRGKGIIVIEPPELREKVISLAKETIGNYEMENYK